MCMKLKDEGIITLKNPWVQTFLPDLMATKTNNEENN